MLQLHVQVIFCTGKFTYYIEVDSIKMKKMVQAVKKLYESYHGSHPCVFID